MWSVLAPFIDEVAAAAIGRLFLWRTAPCRIHRACRQRSPAEFRGDLRQFYSDPCETFQWDWTETTGKQADIIDVCDGHFTSPVRSGFPENDLVHVRRWRKTAPHAASAFGTPSPENRTQLCSGDQSAGLSVIGLGGLVQLGYHWFDRLAESLASRGIDFWMVDEPFNHRRTPPGFLPGELIAGAGPEQLIAAVRQAVIDVRVLISALRQRGQRVGLVGQSYGGWLSLLLATLEEDLEFVVSLIPMCDLPAWYSAGLPLSRGARRRSPGYTKLQLYEMLQPINPIAWKPRLAPHRIDLHAAKRDRLVLYRSIAQLARAWGCRFTAHQSGHYSLFFGGALREHIVRFALETATGTPQPEHACLGHR